MAEERLFGNSIDQKVVDEIKRREKLLSKGDATNSNILPDDPQNLRSLRYTTQRGAWVRMISSVDVKDNPDTATFSPETSKRFILTGGEITSDGLKREGISFDQFDPSKSYRKTATLGVRPEAGITSFSIQHKGTYGSLREAEITFNVWSKEDLNRAQDIYLRPGVHMIVEWGHTIDSNGNLVALPDTSKYFQSSTRTAVQQLINAHRRDNLSYEGFIGLVTNFSWSFREDGGYDCSVKVISAGAVMEALTLIQGKGSVTSGELDLMGVKEEDGKSQSQTEYKKSLMHSFILGVKRDPNIFPGFGLSGKLSFVDLSASPPETTTTFSKSGQVSVVTNLQRLTKAVENLLKINNISLYGFSTSSSSDPTYFRYITIRDLLKFLNASEFFPKAPNGERSANFFIEPDNQTFSTYPKFKTFPEHFSLDIKTCFLPRPPSISFGVGNGQETEFLQEISLQEPLKNVFLSAAYLGQVDNIQSILVELDFLLETFDAALSSEEDNIYKLNVFSFMQNLLRGINNALGNITDLDLHFDESLQQYIIVDREAVGNREDLKKVAELSFTGLSNTVQKVSIQTKITPQLSSQIAISAQGTNSIREGNSNSNLPLIQWNQAIQDRFVEKSNSLTAPLPNLPIFLQASTLSQPDNLVERSPSGLQTSPPILSSPTTPSYVDRFLKPWSTAFKELVVGTYKGWWILRSNSTQYRADLFSKLRRFGIGYFREKYFNSIGGEANQDKTSDPGLIPIELSITLDGIGGLKIGQVFKLDQIDKFLPDAYKDYGFIITGIDSSIESSKWSTTLRALTFKIPTTSPAAPGGATEQAPATSAVNTYIQNVPWSAGFISFIVKPAAPTFPSSGQHTVYAQNLRTNTPPGWEVLDPLTTRPIAGDIVVRNASKQRPVLLAFGTNVWAGASHGDIITEVNSTGITYIGGNLSDKVAKGTIIGQFLPTSANVDFPYFAILRPPASSRTSIVARANAEFNKWSRNGWKETTPAAYSTIYDYYVAGNIHRLPRNNGINLTPLPPPTP